MTTTTYRSRLASFRSSAWPALAALAFVATSAVPSSRADTLFTDTFSSGSLNANGWYFYGAPGAAAWGTAAAPAGSTLLSGTTMRRQSGGTQSNTTAIKTFTSFEFINVGDSISVSLDMHAQGTAGALLVGFFDAPAISANALDGTYNAGTTGFQLRQGYAANSTASYRDGDGTALFTDTATNTVGNSLDHTLTFTLTLTNEGLRLSGSVAGTSLATYTDTSITTGSGFKVNALRLSNNSASQSYFDNIVVTTTVIPEPSAVWYSVGIGGVALFSIMRKRRRGI